MSRTIDNSADIIDSREVIDRIEELETLTDTAELDEVEELRSLLKVAEQGSGSPDWPYGEALIRDTYFTRYIEELIDDCYSLPKELTSGDWPWRHITVDYEAAADEAKADYIDVDFDGVTYWIRG